MLPGYNAEEYLNSPKHNNTNPPAATCSYTQPNSLIDGCINGVTSGFDTDGDSTINAMGLIGGGIKGYKARIPGIPGSGAIGGLAGALTIATVGAGYGCVKGIVNTAVGNCDATTTSYDLSNSATTSNYTSPNLTSDINAIPSNFSDPLSNSFNASLPFPSSSLSSSNKALTIPLQPTIQLVEPIDFKPSPSISNINTNNNDLLNAPNLGLIGDHSN